MTGKIIKIPQRAGQLGRPPHVKVVGAKHSDPQPQIIGAALPGEPTIIDRVTPGEIPTEVEVRHHSVEIREGEGQIRNKKPEPGAPEVRVVTVDQPKWDKVKRGEDE